MFIRLRNIAVLIDDLAEYLVGMSVTINIFYCVS